MTNIGLGLEGDAHPAAIRETIEAQLLEDAGRDHEAQLHVETVIELRLLIAMTEMTVTVDTHDVPSRIQTGVMTTRTPLARWTLSIPTLRTMRPRSADAWGALLLSAVASSRTRRIQRSAVVILFRAISPTYLSVPAAMDQMGLAAEDSRWPKVAL